MMVVAGVLVVQNSNSVLDDGGYSNSGCTKYSGITYTEADTIRCNNGPHQQI